MRACLPTLLLAGCCAAPARHDPGGPSRDTGAPADTGHQDTGRDDTGDTSGDTGAPPAPSLYAGFRASRYGVDPFPEPAYWQGVGESMAARFEGAAPAGLWIVGVAGDDGTCYLGFPSPGGSFTDVGFTAQDQSEDWLAWFDAHGLSVWLQVEPGDAEVETLIGLVLDRYGHHPSVVGVGVDLEWYRWLDHDSGAAVSDRTAAAWRDAVRAYDPSYTLFLKHWLADRMPPGERDGLLFVDDGQGVGSLAALVATFTTWGQAFAPAPVAFQYGYAADRSWWSRLDDPPGDIGAALLAANDNTRGLFWVDFTVEEVFPP
ncbi:MAG: hypothetical protein ABIO70_01185 [Pseudomonadota bacterium]